MRRIGWAWALPATVPTKKTAGLGRILRVRLKAIQTVCVGCHFRLIGLSAKRPTRSITLKAFLKKELAAYQAVKQSPQYKRMQQFRPVKNAYLLALFFGVLTHKFRLLELHYSRPESAMKIALIGFTLASCALIYALVLTWRFLRDGKTNQATPQTSTNPYAPPRDDSGKPSP